MQHLTLTCQTCSRVYEYQRGDTKGHTKSHCNSCQVNVRRFAKKDKCLEYKGGCCERCGYDKCKRALSFHHLDPSKKDFTVSGKHCLSWEKLKAEIDKCILVCANCHMEIHENETRMGQ